MHDHILKLQHIITFIYCRPAISLQWVLENLKYNQRNPIPVFCLIEIKI